MQSNCTFSKRSHPLEHLPGPVRSDVQVPAVTGNHTEGVLQRVSDVLIIDPVSVRALSAC